MSGEWSGGIANRTWQRPGSRHARAEGDDQRGPRLYAQLARTPFWCDNCGGCHPLAEHRQCRDQNPFRTAFRGAT